MKGHQIKGTEQKKSAVPDPEEGLFQKPFPDPCSHNSCQTVKKNCRPFDDQIFCAEKFHKNTLDPDCQSAVLAKDLFEKQLSLCHSGGGAQHDPVMMGIKAETGHDTEPDHGENKQKDIPDRS
jgi:hypothetical protein